MTRRTFPPAPGWSPGGHRVKGPLAYSRGPEKVWVYGALRVRDGQALTLTAPARNTAGYKRLLEAVAEANPDGELYIIGDNLSSHKSPPIPAWLAAHPRVHAVYLPKGACWLNLQEAWWRLFRKEAFAGQTFADGDITFTVTARGQLSHEFVVLKTDLAPTALKMSAPDATRVDEDASGQNAGELEGPGGRPGQGPEPDAQAGQVRPPLQPAGPLRRRHARGLRDQIGPAAPPEPTIRVTRPCWGFGRCHQRSNPSLNGAGRRRSTLVR